MTVKQVFNWLFNAFFIIFGMIIMGNAVTFWSGFVGFILFIFGIAYSVQDGIKQ